VKNCKELKRGYGFEEELGVGNNLDTMVSTREQNKLRPHSFFHKRLTYLSKMLYLYGNKEKA
jgi:hypothetical protein